jgi:hypothetical protein
MDEFGRSAGIRYLLNGLFATAVINVGDDDPDSFAREVLCDATANTRPGSGHDSDALTHASEILLPVLPADLPATL